MRELISIHLRDKWLSYKGKSVNIIFNLAKESLKAWAIEHFESKKLQYVISK